MKSLYLWWVVIILMVVVVGVYLFTELVHAPEATEREVNTIQEQVRIINNNNDTLMSLTLTSPNFKEGEKIPSKYTCDGENINPELHITNVPEGTKSLVLVMDDPDIPENIKQSKGIEKFDHWVLYNIPPDTTTIAADSSVGSEGLTSRGEVGYVGSCPPDREHRYIFRLYALANELNFEQPPTLDEVEALARENALENAVLVGRYERIK